MAEKTKETSEELKKMFQIIDELDDLESTEGTEALVRDKREAFRRSVVTHLEKLEEDYQTLIEVLDKTLARINETVGVGLGAIPPNVSLDFGLTLKEQLTELKVMSEAAGDKTPTGESEAK